MIPFTVPPLTLTMQYKKVPPGNVRLVRELGEVERGKTGAGAVSFSQSCQKAVRSTTTGDHDHRASFSVLLPQSTEYSMTEA